MSNRFTERVQRVIIIAQEEAKRLNHDYVGTEHILLGLVAYYDVTGDRNALEAASRAADYTIGQLGPGKADIVKSGEWKGLEPCSILEPIVLLYRRTGDGRYLRMAEKIAAEFAATDAEGRPLAGDFLDGPLAGIDVHTGAAVGVPGSAPLDARACRASVRGTPVAPLGSPRVTHGDASWQSHRPRPATPARPPHPPGQTCGGPCRTGPAPDSGRRSTRSRTWRAPRHWAMSRRRAHPAP